MHIRFRLGGEHWPPIIYYKVFTHRNIADIGAFAPRDYNHEANVKREKKRLGVKEPEEGFRDPALYVRYASTPSLFCLSLSLSHTHTHTHTDMSRTPADRHISECIPEPVARIDSALCFSRASLATDFSRARPRGCSNLRVHVHLRHASIYNVVDIRTMPPDGVGIGVTRTTDGGS